VSRRGIAWTTAAVLGLALLAAGLFGYWTWRGLHQPYRGYPEAGRTVVVPDGMNAGQILLLLEREGILANAQVARQYLIRVLDDPALKAGEYRFEGAISAVDCLDKIVRGEVMTHRVTLIEGLTLEETAAALATAGFGNEERFLEAMRRGDAVADLDPDAEDLEGYLFPDTYAFAAGTSEASIVATLVETFRSRLETSVRPLIAADEAATVRGLVTLASIIEKEAQLDEERPMIAGVYANRLRRGIALYADPTIIFALKRSGTWDGNLRKPDLALDSPYNTYRHAGLPPGPICSPGQKSLEAAARPADVPYIYFVSRNDGSHVFSSTLAEHNRNVDQWQKRYWRERWARERREKAAAEAGD